MSSETLWARMRRQPFKPFRIHTSDGRHYDVFHPEMIYISKSSVVVAIYDRSEKPGEDLPSRDAILSPLHVASVVDLPIERRRKSA
jgi:hypothetical protein